MAFDEADTKVVNLPLLPLQLTAALPKQVTLSLECQPWPGMRLVTSCKVMAIAL